MEKYIIWQNRDLDIYEEEIRDLRPDVSETELWQWKADMCSEDLDCERINLDKEMGEIVCIADLGLWNGRRQGYKWVGTNLKDCLMPEEDYCTFYVDEKNELRCDAIHHDGTNYLTYRLLKKEYTRFEAEELVYDGTKWEDITEPLGSAVGKIYGWEVA